MRRGEALYAWVESHAAAMTGLVALAVWAFFEANFWFIAPDFLLIILGFVVPHRWLAVSLAALGGSLLGGLFYFGLLQLWFAEMESVLKVTPFVTDRMHDFIIKVYTDYGYGGILVQSLSFMSFKIWTYQAVRFEFSPWIYFPLVMISRAFRLMLVTWIASKVGRLVNVKTRPHFHVLVVVYAIAFIAMLIVVET